MNKKTMTSKFRRFFSDHTILMALAIMFVLLFATTDRFRSMDNFLSILQEASFIGIAGIGMTFCIITGGLDLSSGSMIALLAVINMLPLPALDGGRILFVLFTMITGKKVSEKVEGTVHIIGLVLLLALMLYVTKNDIFRLIG